MNLVHILCYVDLVYMINLVQNIEEDYICMNYLGIILMSLKILILNKYKMCTTSIQFNGFIFDDVNENMIFYLIFLDTICSSIQSLYYSLP